MPNRQPVGLRLQKQPPNTLLPPGERNQTRMADCATSAVCKWTLLTSPRLRISSAVDARSASDCGDVRGAIRTPANVICDVADGKRKLSSRRFARFDYRLADTIPVSAAHRTLISGKCSIGVGCCPVGKSNVGR
jgi:hypothetical protein